MNPSVISTGTHTTDDQTQKSIRQLARQFQSSLDSTAAYPSNHSTPRETNATSHTKGCGPDATFVNMGGRRKCPTRKPTSTLMALQDLVSSAISATSNGTLQLPPLPFANHHVLPNNITSPNQQKQQLLLLQKESAKESPFISSRRGSSQQISSGLNALLDQFLKHWEVPLNTSLDLSSLHGTTATPPFAAPMTPSAMHSDSINLHSIQQRKCKEIAHTFFQSLSPQAQYAFLREHVVFRSHGYEWLTSNHHHHNSMRNPATMSLHSQHMKKKNHSDSHTGNNSGMDPNNVSHMTINNNNGNGNNGSTANNSKKELHRPKTMSSSRKGLYGDANSKFNLKIPVITHDEGYLQRKPQLVFALGNSFTRGGDVRDPMNGRLIFSVHKKRVGGKSSLFLLDEEHGKVPVWKLSERPGEAGSSYDLYGRSATTGCGASGWRLRGHIDRIASCASMLPRFLIHCMGATVALAGDSMSGEDYVFHDILTSEVVGTLLTQSQKIKGRSNSTQQKSASEDDDGQVFYEQMKLMFDAPIECFQEQMENEPTGSSPSSPTLTSKHGSSSGKRKSSLPHLLSRNHVAGTDLLDAFGTRTTSNIAPPSSHSFHPQLQEHAGYSYRTHTTAAAYSDSATHSHPKHKQQQGKSLYQDKFKLKISAANTTIAARHNCLPLSQLVLPPEMFLAGALVVLFMIREERNAILRLEK